MFLRSQRTSATTRPSSARNISAHAPTTTALLVRRVASALRRDVATVDDELGGGDVARLVGEQEAHDAPDLRRFAEQTEKDAIREAVFADRVECGLHHRRADLSR